MIRYSLLFVAITFLCVYAFRDWYRSLCGLVVLMAFIERYDMPRQMLGITGLNPWNILVLFVVIACVLSARRERLTWDMPKQIQWLLVAYFAVILLGFGRMTGNVGQVFEYYITTGRKVPSYTDLILNDLLNCVKFVIPGMLMFYGAKSQQRVLLGVFSCLLASLFLGLQVIKWMPISGLADGDLLADRALRVLDRAIGYHRVDLAALTASASWAMLLGSEFVSKKALKWALRAGGALMVLALALTGGRTGYATWAVLGVLFAVIKWRRLLLYVPVAALLLFMVVPAAQERLLQGFETEEFDYIESDADLAAVTSDRILIWPIVIDQIGNSPLLGYGRHGIFISGAADEMRDVLGAKGAGFPHPHNAYLELLIDNGAIGAFPVFLFFFLVLKYSVYQIRLVGSRACNIVGGAGFAYVAGQLLASIGAQSFYPRAGVVIMWCMIGLVLRCQVQIQKSMSGRAVHLGPGAQAGP